MKPVIPLSLYIHIPWCIRKCPYCDFNSHERKAAIDEAGYVRALLADLDSQLPLVWGRPVRTVFIGGGTPSLFSGEAMADLLSGLRARLRLTPDTEITLEANPGAIDSGHFRDYFASGINRLSIGVQSMDPQRLKQLGRIHSIEDTHTAIAVVKDAGFTNFNLDMMFGLPGQTLESAAAELEILLPFQPTHLSYYQLTIEPNTAFHHRPPGLPDEDLIADMQVAVIELLAKHGYERYEISAYARAGHQCKHNLNYWHYGDYLGIGAGAHSKITDVVNNTITRSVKQKKPEAYMANAGTPSAYSKNEPVTLEDRPFEFMMNALRLNSGFDEELYLERTGLELDTIRDRLDQAVEKGLLAHQAGLIRPTPLGLDFLNNLVAEFLPGAS